MLEKCKLPAIFCTLFHNPWPQPRELEDQIISTDNTNRWPKHQPL